MPAANQRWILGKDGKLTSIDKTWQFVKDDAGQLRIDVHHSSMAHSDKRWHRAPCDGPPRVDARRRPCGRAR